MIDHIRFHGDRQSHGWLLTVTECERLVFNRGCTQRFAYQYQADLMRSLFTHEEGIKFGVHEHTLTFLSKPVDDRIRDVINGKTDTHVAQYSYPRLGKGDSFTGALRDLRTKIHSELPEREIVLAMIDDAIGLLAEGR